MYLHWYISWPLRRDVPTQLIIDRLIVHKPNRDSRCSDRTKRKSRWKDKNKHQKDALRRSWQRDLNAINEKGCAKEDAQAIAAEDAARLMEIAWDTLTERFGENHFIGHMLVAKAVHIQNNEYMDGVRNRYEDHMVLRITHILRWRDIPYKTVDQVDRGGHNPLDLGNTLHSNDEDEGDDSAPPSNQRKREEEADLDRMIDEERIKYLVETPQPSQDDDVAFCGPPRVTRDGETVTVLERNPDAQRCFGATLRAKRRQEAPYQYWKQTTERRPAKPSKRFDDGDVD